MANLQVKKNRSKVKISYELPVLVVNKSNKYTSVSVLQAKTKKVLKSISSKSVESTGTKTEKASKVGSLMAKYLSDNKFVKVVFDRNGFSYMGRIKALAESVKESGIII
jgi:large subunit ribosomal protein L18